jgi:hypothetical protein
MILAEATRKKIALGSLMINSQGNCELLIYIVAV